MSALRFDLGAGLNVGIVAAATPAPELRPGMRVVIKTDGSEVPIVKPVGIAEIERLIGAHVLDTVNLRRFGLCMFVDDVGAVREAPVNAKATALYHSVCKPGTTWPIRGDVAIVPDADFGSEL